MTRELLSDICNKILPRSFLLPKKGPIPTINTLLSQSCPQWARQQRRALGNPHVLAECGLSRRAQHQRWCHQGVHFSTCIPSLDFWMQKDQPSSSWTHWVVWTVSRNMRNNIRRESKSTECAGEEEISEWGHPAQAACSTVSSFWRAQGTNFKCSLVNKLLGFGCCQHPIKYHKVLTFPQLTLRLMGQPANSSPDVLCKNYRFMSVSE